jgi:hypothetical protein
MRCYRALIRREKRLFQSYQNQLSGWLALPSTKNGMRVPSCGIFLAGIIYNYFERVSSVTHIKMATASQFFVLRPTICVTMLNVLWTNLDYCLKPHDSQGTNITKSATEFNDPSTTVVNTRVERGYYRNTPEINLMEIMIMQSIGVSASTVSSLDGCRWGYALQRLDG